MNRGAGGEASRLRSILVATDLSEEARAAVEAVAHINPPEGAELHVVHAVPEPDPVVAGLGDASARPRDKGAEASDSRAPPGLLASHLQQAGLSAEGVRIHIRTGPPHRVIQAVAHEVDADLIILGRHRPRRVLDGLLRSTAERLVRAMPVPCLLVHRKVEGPPRRLMVASDLSPHSDRALEVAMSWAVQWAAGPTSDARESGTPEVAVDLVNIADFAHPGYRPSSRVEALRRRADEASARAGPTVEVTARTASYPLAPEGILELSEQLRPDLVFLGTHGHGPALRALFGSVASEVIRTLPLAVVLVPLPETR